MKKFNFIKKKAFTWFENNEKKNEIKSESLSQPEKSKSRSEMSPSDKKNRDKKIGKKILIWLLSLGLLAAFIAPIVVTCTRQTEVALSANTDLTFSGNEVTFIDKDNNSNKYVVDFSNPTNLLAAYYRSNSSQVTLKFKTKNNILPISIVGTINRNGNDDPYRYNYNLYIGNWEYIYIPNDSSNNSEKDFARKIVHLYNNASFVPASFNWLGLITSLLPTLLLIALFLIYFSILKKQMGGGQDSIFGMGKSTVKSTKTNIKFADVAGIDEVKEELKELVDYVKNPNKYAAMGARAPKGVILYGPPGTGKTLIAKAVAGEADCNFFPTSGSAFDDMLVGVGAKRVRDLFAKARATAPSIIFIDEIDSVASKRGKSDVMGGGSGIADQTINQLLAEMDGFTSDSGVIVIAATNRLDVLDEAILRPGRFDRQIQVTLPDIKGREAILKIHSRNKNISSDVNLLDVARRTPGFSGAQLENVLNEAAILAVRENKIVIKMNNIDEAIDRVIGGPARHGRVISEHEKKQIAYHEAGHALVGLHTKNTEVVQKITIIPRGDAAGYTMQTPSEHERTIQTKEDLLNQVRMTLGGRAAEEVIYGPSQITTGASNDLYKVSRIVKAMVMSLGMSSKMGLTQFVPSEGNVSPLQPKMYSETTARELDIEIDKIINDEYIKAKNLIKKYRSELELIVETLLVLETIVKPQIDYIHKHKKLPREVYEMKKKQTFESKTKKIKNKKEIEDIDKSKKENKSENSDLNK